MEKVTFWGTAVPGDQSFGSHVVCKVVAAELNDLELGVNKMGVGVVWPIKF